MDGRQKPRDMPIARCSDTGGAYPQQSITSPVMPLFICHLYRSRWLNRQIRPRYKISTYPGARNSSVYLMLVDLRQVIVHATVINNARVHLGFIPFTSGGN